ncbi:glycosyltransferase family 4 protein [uncultured Eubacterium sp.]|uniref:glycosyltransferase family 4 protein n=1 Tax=uncultured Eubacterium sp. TaxID=165185 RepID=UPI0025932222|nr:glycosyltransferase family 4 protein [uncultured Eubacterium sp.]
MAGYVFIGNSSKPTEEQLNSREMVRPGNVSRPCIQTALEMGYEVYLGTNRNRPEELECDLPVKLYDSHTYRSITAFKDNLTAYKNLKKVIKEGNVEVIHCNTPVGGMVGRLCGKMNGVKKVIYTAHGFHFYKGAPLFNRTILKWAEMFMAHWTDAILTMNEEDFQSAKKFRLRKSGKVYYVPGVGINTEEFFSVRIDKQAKRDELGLFMDDIVCISMGDLIPRKNYETSIKAIALCNNPKVHYLICGRGPELDNLKKLAKELGVENQIHFLGFRTDIKELSKVADIFLFTTLQEGMPRSMMEAMASGLPCIASKIRGNVDLLEEGIGGYLVPAKDENAVADRLERLVENLDLREEMRKANLERIKGFDIRVVKKRMEEIYKEVLNK